MEGVVKLRVARSVSFVIVSHINATRLSLSIMKSPLSVLEKSSALVSLNVLESAATTELEEDDEIMRL